MFASSQLRPSHLLLTLGDNQLTTASNILGSGVVVVVLFVKHAHQRFEDCKLVPMNISQLLPDAQRWQSSADGTTVSHMWELAACGMCLIYCCMPDVR